MNTNEHQEPAGHASAQRFADRQFRVAAIYLVRHRRILAMLLLILCFAGLYFSRNISIDNSLELWFLEGDPALEAYNEFKKRYGNDEVILAMIDCSRDGMFSPATLSAIYKASKEIEDDTHNFKRVLSVGLSPFIGLSGEELIIEDLMSGPVNTLEEAEKIRQRFMDDPFKQRILKNASATWAIIIAEPVATPDMDSRRPEIIDSMRQKLKGFNFRLAGMGVMYNELNRLSIQDGVVFNAVAYVAIALMVYILYRSWVFLFMALGAMFFSGLGFLGFYGLFGQNFNMVTIVLPTLMMILSVSDVAYAYNNYCFNSARVRENREEGLEYVFYEVLSPCLFTSLTNFAGFLALVTSPLDVLRVFGAFAAFACMAEYVVSMIVAAFILGQIELKEEVQIRRPFEAQVDWWMQRMPRYYVHILVIVAILSVMSVYGIAKLQVDTYSMGFLHDSNPIRVDSDAVEANYGNYLPLEVRLLTGQKEGVKKVEFLRRLDRTIEDLLAVPGMEKPASILDVLKKMNEVMSDGPVSETYVVPASDEAVSQLLLLYESDTDNDLEYMTDYPDYSETRLTIRVPMISAAGLYEFEQKTQAILEKNFGGSTTTWKFGGYVPLYARIISYVTWSQINSFASAFILVFGAIYILFRRLKAMFLVILPNIFPILFTLGFMGWSGIKLDIASVTIAAIAMGIVVDDTIHALYLFYDPSRSKFAPVEAVVDGIREAGPAIVSTSLIYSIGFLFMVFASIKSVINFGLLLSMTIIVALFCELTIMPAQICLLKRFLADDFRDDKIDQKVS